MVVVKKISIFFMTGADMYSIHCIKFFKIITIDETSAQAQIYILYSGVRKTMHRFVLHCYL